VDRAAEAIPNCQYWTTAHRVVALAHLGRHDDAERARDPAGVCPRFTIGTRVDKLFYLKRPEQLDLYLDGLQLAGVPDE
jgi:adenylate cyclase